MKLTILRFLMIFFITLLFRFVITLVMIFFSLTDDAHEINVSLNKTINNILNFPIGLFEKNKFSIALVLLNTFIQSTLLLFITTYKFKENSGIN